MLVLPHPDDPTSAANLPFSICSAISVAQELDGLDFTVKLRPVKMGISRVGYLNHKSLSSILTPPSMSWISNGVLEAVLLLFLKLKIRFAAAEA